MYIKGMPIYKQGSFVSLDQCPFNKCRRCSFTSCVDNNHFLPAVNFPDVAIQVIVESVVCTMCVTHLEDAGLILGYHTVYSAVGMLQDQTRCDVGSARQVIA